MVKKIVDLAAVMEQMAQESSEGKAAFLKNPTVAQVRELVRLSGVKISGKARRKADIIAAFIQGYREQQGPQPQNRPVHQLVK